MFGIDSRLLQAKLGHDLRPMLDETFRGPLPDRLQHLADELMGYAEYRVVRPGLPAAASPIAAGALAEDRPLF